MSGRPTHKKVEDVLVRLNPRRTDVPRYERTGECSRCGACCAFEDPPCEHFTPATDTEPASCAIWDDPDRDATCREWPVGPPIKIKTCTFRFKDLSCEIMLAPGTTI